MTSVGLIGPVRYHTGMDDWHGFGAKLSISQIYETTVADSGSGLSAHFVVVPARSLGGDRYLFSGTADPFEALRLQALADVPAGGVVRSLAACLEANDAAAFLRSFHEGFKEEGRLEGVWLPPAFAFAEYLTFARVVPFEWSEFSAEALGSILTASGYGRAAYVRHEQSDVPMLVVAVPAGMLVCGATQKMEAALEGGMRRDILELVRTRSDRGGRQDGT